MLSVQEVMSLDYGENMKYLDDLVLFEKYNLDYEFMNDQNIRIKTWLGFINYNLKTHEYTFFQLGKLKGKGFYNMMAMLKKR